jgi:hypothetical chaperone protein
MTFCGLDFGTSNTTLGVMADGGPRLVTLEGGETVVPTAIFYRRAGGQEIGRAAIRAYVDGEPGRLMRSLKSVLGSDLIEEVTQVGRERLSFRQVIAGFLRIVHARAAAGGVAPGAVCCGRPVHFVDEDDAGDARAENALAACLREAGFGEVSFQYEPIAAALDYEQQIRDERIALIADIGGGTSDFSIVRLGPDRHRAADRAADILANDGVRVGGTDFDRGLSLGAAMPHLGLGATLRAKNLPMPAGLFHDLATWSSINRLYDARVRRTVAELKRDAVRPELVGRLERVIEEERGHGLAMQIEDAKIALSGAEETRLDLGWLERGLAPAISRPEMIDYTAAHAARIGACVTRCLAGAGLAPAGVDAVFLTGGSTRLPHVRRAIVQALPDAEIVEGDLFGSVGTGLTLEAKRRYG